MEKFLDKELSYFKKKFLSQNQYGNLHTISCRRFSPYPGRISDVGVLFDLTIHDVDIISSLFDDNIVSIFASGGSLNGSEHEDYITLVMNFENIKYNYYDE